MNGIKNRPPSNEEIELTLLGPGYGESIVIHIGDNKWVIIDSCIDSKGDCAPLNYLKLIGVSPDNVILIVASHWHDDHVKRISNLVSECASAKFCCSSAFNTDEVMAYITSYHQIDSLIKSSSGVRELYETLKVLRTRKYPQPIHAVSNKRIFAVNSLSHSHCCEVWSLSPSDKEIKNFIAGIKNITPIEKDVSTIAPKPRNNLSVVIQINIGNEILLLGSDLEQTTDKLTGWNIIVESEEKPQGKAIVFKIPHHGSITGHSDDVWKHLVDENSYAILTPYNRGKKLPASDDVNRIRTYTEKAYSTISLNAKETCKKRDSKIQKKIDDTIIGSMRSIDKKMGMLRLRKKINSPFSDWNLEKFDGGCHLSEVYSIHK